MIFAGVVAISGLLAVAQTVHAQAEDGAAHEAMNQMMEMMMPGQGGQ